MSRGRALGCLLSVALLSACGPPIEEFSTLQPLYFSALSVFDESSRRDQPGFDERLSRMADAVLARLDRGEITSPADREEAGRALTYAGFFLVAEKQEIEDGYLAAADVLHKPRYGRAVADGGTDRDEQLARLERSSRLLSRAAELRPSWSPPQAMHRAVRYDLEDMGKGVSAQVVDALISSAENDTFSTFTALALFRDATLHPLSKPYMDRLFGAVCGPKRFDCDRMGPPPIDPMEERSLTRKVNGPAWLADFLVRRAEHLLARADADPAQAMPALGEAMGRVQMAAAILLSAQLSAQADDLAVYPAREALDVRQDRVAQLRTAVSMRLAGTSAPPPPETREFYASQPYRAIYQCASCHMPRPNLPAIFHDVPR